MAARGALDLRLDALEARLAKLEAEQASPKKADKAKDSK